MGKLPHQGYIMLYAQFVRFLYAKCKLHFAGEKSSHYTGFWHENCILYFMDKNCYQLSRGEKMLDLNLEWLEVRELRQREAELRKHGRKLSAQIEKLGEAFLSTMKSWEKVGEKADKLEKKLFEEAGRVKYLRTRKHGTKREPATIHKAALTARAVQLAAEGKLEEAKELLRSNG